MMWIGCGSCGNSHMDRGSIWRPILGGSFVVCFAIYGYITNEHTGVEPSVHYLRVWMLILGCIVVCMHILHCLFLCSKKDSALHKKLTEHAYKSEVDLKNATSFKLNRMVENAMDIHKADDNQNVVKTCFGHGLQVFSKFNKVETIGGFVWYWKKLLSGELFRQEGLWYSSRLIAANISQYIVVLYIVLSGIVIIHKIVKEFGEEHTEELLRGEIEQIFDTSIDNGDVVAFTSELAAYIAGFLNTLAASGIFNVDCESMVNRGVDVLTETCGDDLFVCNSDSTTAVLESICALLEVDDLTDVQSLKLLDGAGVKSEVLLNQFESAMIESVDDTVKSLYPSTVHMVTIPVVVGTAAAVLTSVFLAVNYLPSVTATTFQLRTGVIPTLGDPKLNVFRASVRIFELLTRLLVAIESSA